MSWRFAENIVADPLAQPIAIKREHARLPLTSRRGFLRSAIALVPAGTLVGCDAQINAPSHAGSIAYPSAQDSTSKLRAAYKPRFFDANEWAFVNAAVDRLIPADSEGPGAVEAGVPECIDRQMATPYAHGALWYMQGPFKQGAPELGYQLKLMPRDLYRRGIASANAYCAKTHAKSFDALDAATPYPVHSKRPALICPTCPSTCSSRNCRKILERAISAIRSTAATTARVAGR